MDNGEKRSYLGMLLPMTKPVMSYIVLDTETTGLSPKKDYIIEVAALKVINDRVVDQFQTLVKPPRNKLGFLIPNAITKLTGIDDSMVDDAPSFCEIREQLVSFIGQLPIVGHNVIFDINFLYESMERCCSSHISNDYIDTLGMARLLFPNIKHNLSSVSSYLNVKNEHAHRALSDVYTTYECYRIMRNMSLK